MFRMALNIAHAVPGEVAYLEDRPMFVEVARRLGIHGILHTGLASTQAQLAELGLSL